jgi:uncharacterized membrane protein HdeD (DUF308 family)
MDQTNFYWRTNDFSEAVMVYAAAGLIVGAYHQLIHPFSQAYWIVNFVLVVGIYKFYAYVRDSQAKEAGN